MTRRGLGVVAAILLWSVLLAACSTDPADVPTRAAAFRPVPEVAPLRRLGRWDGTTFTPVERASVSRGHLYVLVPGSAPRQLFGLAAAITDGDPDAVVLGYRRLTDAATADLDGQRLAFALDDVLAPAFRADGGLIHLIGQGPGAKVAVVAGIALPQPPEQITVLESRAVNHLEGYLPLLPLGRTPGKTFVDSYFSLAGTRYAAYPALTQVVDVALGPRPSGYATRWYSDSARRASVGVGFGWSPLVGAPPACLLCFFFQIPQVTRPDGSRPDPLDLRLVPAPIAVRRESRPVDATVVRGPETGREPEGVELVAPGRRLWKMEFSRNPGDLALSFDTRFIAPTRGAQLGVFLDDRAGVRHCGRLGGEPRPARGGRREPAVRGNAHVHCGLGPTSPRWGGRELRPPDPCRPRWLPDRGRPCPRSPGAGSVRCGAGRARRARCSGPRRAGRRLRGPAPPRRPRARGFRAGAFSGGVTRAWTR